jgi:hypothetical protein
MADIKLLRGTLIINGNKLSSDDVKTLVELPFDSYDVGNNIFEFNLYDKDDNVLLTLKNIVLKYPELTIDPLSKSPTEDLERIVKEIDFIISVNNAARRLLNLIKKYFEKFFGVKIKRFYMPGVDKFRGYFYLFTRFGKEIDFEIEKTDYATFKRLAKFVKYNYGYGFFTLDEDKNVMFRLPFDPSKYFHWSHVFESYTTEAAYNFFLEQLSYIEDDFDKYAVPPPV